METRKQIAVSGYYGSGNLGDEAILEGLTKGITDRFGQQEIHLVVLSDDPEETKKHHNLDSVNRWSPIQVTKSLNRADLLISGGGGLLQDRTSSFSLWYYLGVIWLAKLLGTPVYILGQGIGPINHRLNKLFLSWTIKQTNGALVRDEASLDLLQSMNLHRTKVNKGTDLAFLLPERENSQDDFFEDDNPEIVAAALRNDIHGKMDVVRAVSSGLDLLNQKFGVNVILFSTNSAADRQINHDLCEATDTSCNIIDVPHLTPTQLVKMMKGIDLIIGGRLHVIVFSLLSGTPVQGISYDPKMDHLINSINDSTDSPSVPLWHPEELINARDYLADLEATYKKKGEQKRYLKQVRKKFKREAEEGLEMALDWIDRELYYG